MKKVLFATAVVCLLATMSFAQASKSVPASLSEAVQQRGTSTVMSHNFQTIYAPKAPSYCKPCFYYAGDIDPNNSNANGLANEEDQAVADSHIYSPFKVSSKGVSVSGLFVNSLDGVGAIDNPTPYSVSKGIKSGVAGKVVFHGKAKSTDSPTGRSAFGLSEYTHLVKFKAKALKAGTYFINVTPVCLTGSSCGSARYFESDEESDPKPINHVGPKNILDDSFWNSTSFGTNYEPTWGSSGGCGGVGCDAFSAGVLGK